MSFTLPTIEPVHGVILSVQGQTPGRDFTYTCALNLPEGKAVVAGLLPTHGRWDAPMNMRPQAVNTGVIGTRVNGVLQMHFFEQPDYGTCQDQP